MHLYIDVNTRFSEESKKDRYSLPGRCSAQMDEDARTNEELTVASCGDEGHNPHDGFPAKSRVDHLVEQLKQRRAELETANRELRRVSHYRSLFLARMSHELRTPLTSILGFSEILLEQEELTEAQRRFCLKIQDSGLQLQASLNQLVELSRLESGRTELFFQESSLREILREACAAVARFAQKHQVTLEYESEPEVSTVVSDLGKLRQVLYNFLSWAVSRSALGQAVKIRGGLIEPATLQIQIDDSGPPLTDPEHLFDPDASSEAGDDTTKIGIVIGRQLLDVMGGRVVLEHRDADGLRVLIQLPARPTKG